MVASAPLKKSTVLLGAGCVLGREDSARNKTISVDLLTGGDRDRACLLRAHPNGVVPVKGSNEHFPAVSPGCVLVQPIGTCVL